jgi:two-component system chemotaxis response regulator CheB
MIVDDAAAVRRVLAQWIKAEPDLCVVASLADGREALAEIERIEVDVVVLDVDMPGLDGIAALPLLLAKRPDLVAIMVSALTRRSAEVSLRALALGAADYVSKPDAITAYSTREFQREFISKVRALGRGRALRRRLGPPAMARPVPPLPKRERTDNVALVPPPRPFARSAPRAIVIGASTGGPQALTALLARLSDAIDRAPVLIAQHMPPTFTTVLAEHLSRVAGRGTHEAEDGEPVLPGGIYVAPGGRHMRVERSGSAVRIALGDDAPINFCRPAVDALFASAAAVWGPATLAVVLTGMGADGMRGAGEVVAAGGSVIAQDEATSVVWGMPRAVAQAGLCSAVLPLADIGPQIVHLLTGAQP